MVHRAQVAHYARNATRWGVNASDVSVDLPKIVAQKDKVVLSMRGSQEKQAAKRSNITLYRRHARFISAHQLDVGEETLARITDHRTPAHWAEFGERREHVRAAVLELPVEFREAIVLCELEELSYEEAAKALDCPIGTIRSRLHRGRALLLAKLEILRDVPKRAGAGR